MLPFILSFFLSICEWLRWKDNWVYNYGKDSIDWFLVYKYEVGVKKCNIELFLLFGFLFEWWSGRFGGWVVLFYGNYLRVKYLVNPQMKLTCQKMDWQVERVLGCHWCVRPVLWGWVGVRWVVGLTTRV